MTRILLASLPLLVLAETLDGRRTLVELSVDGVVLGLLLAGQVAVLGSGSVEQLLRGLPGASAQLDLTVDVVGHAAPHGG